MMMEKVSFFFICKAFFFCQQPYLHKVCFEIFKELGYNQAGELCIKGPTVTSVSSIYLLILKHEQDHKGKQKVMLNSFYYYRDIEITPNQIKKLLTVTDFYIQAICSK